MREQGRLRFICSAFTVSAPHCWMHRSIRQLGQRDERKFATLVLLSQMMREPCFTELRTKQQIGCVGLCHHHFLHSDFLCVCFSWYDGHLFWWLQLFLLVPSSRKEAIWRMCSGVKMRWLFGIPWSTIAHGIGKAGPVRECCDVLYQLHVSSLSLVPLRSITLP